jgi:phosphoglycerol transferase MdoB-like AlkP superfamily enzyme
MRKLGNNIYVTLLLSLGLSFVLLSATRLIFFFINASYFPKLELKDWWPIIQGGIKFDIAAVLYTNTLFILLQIFPFTFRYHIHYRKITKIVFILSNILMIAFSVLDMIYFKYTLRRSTWMIFREFSNESNRTRMILLSLLEYWYILPIFLIFVLVLIFLFNKIEAKVIRPKHTRFHHTRNLAFFITIPVLFVGGVRGDFKYSTRPITMSNAGEYVSNPALIPLVLNTPFCVLRTMQQQFYTKDNFFDENDVPKYYDPIQTIAQNKDFKYDNVVIIILESFGLESVGFYNKGLDGGRYKGYTPFLDSLLAEGFTANHSFANGRKSIDALPSVLMGIPSGEIPFVLTPYVSNKSESLPQILKSKGYATAFFHGAPNGSMGFKALMNLIGVEQYYGKDEYGKDEDFDGTWGIWDEPFFQFTAEKINGLKEPFMSTLFSVSSHEPFKVPPAYKGKFPKGDHPLREVIGYTDQSLRKFFAKAEKMSWFKRTLFVITGDHASISYYPEYKTSWGNMAVPVLFYHPGDTSLRKKDQGVIQQTDIMPTVLSYLHYDRPFLAFGRNVLENTRDKIAFNYHNGFQLFRDQYLLQMKGNEPASLYNYINDPLLQKDLSGELKSKKDSMTNTIKAVIQHYHNRLIGDQLTASNSNIR